MALTTYSKLSLAILWIAHHVNFGDCRTNYIFPDRYFKVDPAQRDCGIICTAFYSPNPIPVKYYKYAQGCDTTFHNTTSQLDVLRNTTKFDVIDYVLNKEGPFAEKLYTEESDSYWEQLLNVPEAPEKLDLDKYVKNQNPKTCHRMYKLKGKSKNIFIIAALISSGTRFDNNTETVKAGANNNLSGVQALVLAIRAAQRQLAIWGVQPLNTIEFHFYVMNQKTHNMFEIGEILETYRDKRAAGFLELFRVGFYHKDNKSSTLGLTVGRDREEFGRYTLKMMNCWANVTMYPPHMHSISGADYAVLKDIPTAKLESINDGGIYNDQDQVINDSVARLSNQTVIEAAVAAFIYIIENALHPME